MIPFRQFLKETLEKRHQIPTPLKRSEHSGLDVFGEWRAGDRQGKSKVVSVHPKHIRATQEWVDKRWDGKERSTESSHKEAPAGIRTKDGNVHLTDGHHRAADAHKSKQHLDVSVVDVDQVRPYATTKNEGK